MAAVRAARRKPMKRFAATVVIVLFSFLAAGTGEARYKNGYVVVAVTDATVTIQDESGEKIAVDSSPGDLAVGDKVQYDARKHKLKRDSDQQ
jgi:hypothetical protein